MCFAEAGSRVSTSGGPYAYVEAALGPLLGFLTGVLNVLSALAAAGFVASAFAASAATLIGTSSAVVQGGLVAIVLSAAAGINIRSVGGGARLVEVAVVAKVVPLLAFVVVGAAFVRLDYLLWPSTPSTLSVMSTAGVLIFAFLGIEGALQPSGEVHDPSRTVPRAVCVAIAGVVALYVSIQVVAQGLLGAALPGDRVAPLAEAAATVVGPIGRTVMLIGATVSMFGFLCGTVLAGPRSLFAFAQDGLAPSCTGRSPSVPSHTLCRHHRLCGHCPRTGLVRIVRTSAGADEYQRTAGVHRRGRRSVGATTTRRAFPWETLHRSWWSGRSRPHLRDHYRSDRCNCRLGRDCCGRGCHGSCHGDLSAPRRSPLACS